MRSRSRELRSSLSQRVCSWSWKSVADLGVVTSHFSLEPEIS